MTKLGRISLWVLLARKLEWWQCLYAVFCHLEQFSSWELLVQTRKEKVTWVCTFGRLPKESEESEDLLWSENFECCKVFPEAAELPDANNTYLSTKYSNSILRKYQTTLLQDPKFVALKNEWKTLCKSYLNLMSRFALKRPHDGKREWSCKKHSQQVYQHCLTWRWVNII